jgi:hypothetical protein
MSRSRLADPTAQLKDLIAKRGESGHHATEFYGAHITVDPDEHAHLDMRDDAMALLRQLVLEDPEYQQFAAFLSHTDCVQQIYRIPYYYGVKGVAIHYRGETNGVGRASVIMPQVNASRFDVDVEIFSHMIKHWGKLIGTAKNELRFYIDFAFLLWEDMEEENLLFESN